MSRVFRLAALAISVGVAGILAVSRAAPPAGRWTRALEAAGVQDAQVAEAMEEVDRRHFLPAELKPFELSDGPLPLGEGELAPQPSVLARMIQELELQPGCRALVIGAGAGYAAALVSRFCSAVYVLERVEPLAEQARDTLSLLGIGNVQLRSGDGARGWPTAAPFDGILVSTPVRAVPEALIDQLWPGNRIVVPLAGAAEPTLLVVEKRVSGQLIRREVKVGPEVRPSF